MPRQARKTSGTGIYHVMLRGINRQDMMQSGSRIQTTGPNNGHQLRDYSKSSNRSENRPLIYYASTRYYKSAWGYEIWRTSSGKVYDSNILQRQSNGKYVRGVQGIRISKELAKNSMKLPNIIGKRLGGLNIGLNAVNLYKDPTIGNVLNLGRSIGSYYSLPYAALDMFATGSYYEIQNAIENRHGLPGTYSSAVTGYYMLSW